MGGQQNGHQQRRLMCMEVRKEIKRGKERGKGREREGETGRKVEGGREWKRECVCVCVCV